MLLSDEHSDRLVRSRVGADDGGVYKCEVVNHGGSDEDEITVDVSCKDIAIYFMWICIRFWILIVLFCIEESLFEYIQIYRTEKEDIYYTVSEPHGSYINVQCSLHVVEKMNLVTQVDFTG